MDGLDEGDRENGEGGTGKEGDAKEVRGRGKAERGGGTEETGEIEVVADQKAIVTA